MFHKRKFIYDYRNIHTGDAVIVCGLGSSLNDLPNEWIKKYDTIGVNDINAKFMPTYQVLSEGLDESQWGQYLDKIRCIKETRCKTVFSMQAVEFKYTKPIKFELIGLDKCESIEEIYESGKNFAFKKITTAAISLAIWMGYSWIGIIGFDLQGDR